MRQNCLPEESGCGDVYFRIKDLCRESRNRMGYTNQDIADRISERFDIESFSVNTVNNFFSDRSKAATIYTAGYICAVLEISMDEVFGIEHSFSPDEENELVRQISEMKSESRMREQDIRHLEEMLKEKDERIEQAHSAITHYRSEEKLTNQKVQRWMLRVSLVLLFCEAAVIIIYLMVFDFGNPGYGIFG